MEFIIVFPIYLVLFAGTVAIGDRLIHSNRLVSADRIAAYRVDGHVRNGEPLSVWSGWDCVCNAVFHPLQEIADDGQNQDLLTDSSLPHYADSTGPWSVCAAATVHDAYRTLAGGTLGQLLAARSLLGGGTAGGSGLFSASVDMVAKDVRNGASFYTLKRRDHYYQRMQRRFGTNPYIDPDALNWRDREHVSRLLRAKGGAQTENWRVEVAGEGWHTEKTIIGDRICTRCTEASGENIPDYVRYPKFVALSE